MSLPSDSDLKITSPSDHADKTNLRATHCSITHKKCRLSAGFADHIRLCNYLYNVLHQCKNKTATKYHPKSVLSIIHYNGIRFHSVHTLPKVCFTFKNVIQFHNTHFHETWNSSIMCRILILNVTQTRQLMWKEWLEIYLYPK